MSQRWSQSSSTIISWLRPRRSFIVNGSFDVQLRVETECVLAAPICQLWTKLEWRLYLNLVLLRSRLLYKAAFWCPRFVRMWGYGRALLLQYTSFFMDSLLFVVNETLCWLNFTTALIFNSTAYYQFYFSGTCSRFGYLYVELCLWPVYFSFERNFGDFSWGMWL